MTECTQLRKLDELADAHGWQVMPWVPDTDEGTTAIGPQTEGRVYSAPVGDGMDWRWMVAFAKSPHTNRWAALVIDNTFAAVGSLWLGSDLIAERYWRRVADVRAWLPDMSGLAELGREAGWWPTDEASARMRGISTRILRAVD